MAPRPAAALAFCDHPASLLSLALPEGRALSQDEKPGLEEPLNNSRWLLRPVSELEALPSRTGANRQGSGHGWEGRLGPRGLQNCMTHAFLEAEFIRLSLRK